MAARQPNRRVYQERSHRFEDLSNEELLKRYRLNRDGIRFLINMLAGDISPITARNHAVSATVKVLLTLRYLATGKFQLCNGDDHGVSQPTVSRAVNETIHVLSSQQILARFVKFPLQRHELQRNQAAFYQVAHFPGVIGVIDGTHVQIQAPHVNEDVYVNRHHYHSINTQAVFDADDKIIDIVARWPGSTHDSRILTESGLHRLMEGNHLPAGTHLLGDSGYPSKRWMLTPYLRPQPGHQSNYNRAHKRTRCSVERAFGQLKRRFHVLHGEIKLTPEKACKVITTCAVLHNICKDRNIPLPNDGNNPRVNPLPQHGPPIVPAQGVMGVRYREQFAITNFPCVLNYKHKNGKVIFQFSTVYTKPFLLLNNFTQKEFLNFKAICQKLYVKVVFLALGQAKFDKITSKVISQSRYFV